MSPEFDWWPAYEQSSDDESSTFPFVTGPISPYISPHLLQTVATLEDAVAASAAMTRGSHEVESDNDDVE